MIGAGSVDNFLVSTFNFQVTGTVYRSCGPENNEASVNETNMSNKTTYMDKTNIDTNEI